ncbi:MAG: hypothetical protein U0163_14325 [Gemmatimonadaceae bacterium]
MKTRFLALALATVSATAGAQAGRRGPPARADMGPERRPPAGRLATLLLDARRELNLTPRQLVALDSIERQEYAMRRQDVVGMRARRDSVCANRQPCELTPQERRQMMEGPQAQNVRAARLRADSATRNRIFGMLDTTQRRLADRIEYRRELAGRMDGLRWMREARRGREFGPPGMRGDRFGDEQRYGPMDGPRFGPPRFDDGNGPRMGPPGRLDDQGPPRRRWRGGEDSLPPDTTGASQLEK